MDSDDASAIDLRFLNEAAAGDNGWIQTDGHRFIHGNTGQPIRFWAVNSPPWDHYSMEDWQYLARLLAKYGVNQIRLHGSLLFGPAYTRTNQSPDINPLDMNEDKITALMNAVAAMKAEGIYTHLSIYFPLWIQLPANSPEFPGYNGKQNPFATIYFDADLEKRYDSWWKTVLNTVNPHTGIALKDDPALMSVELVNEDSLFFNTFSYKAIPDEQMAILENQFGTWLAQRYGSLSKVAWLRDFPHERDDLGSGRVGFVDLKAMATRKSQRDQDTVRFLYETQRDWYQEKTEYLHALGFKGLITASNWQTANDFIYDGLERSTYMAGDFIDHHKAYFGGFHTGLNASWSLRNGHQYGDRNQLMFQSRHPASQEKAYEIAFIKPTWNNKPTMISETSWERPNRYRSQGMGLYAAYGALHDLDSIVHFCMDSAGRRWFVQPRYIMQVWSLLTPAAIGQFPAAALIYRNGLVKEAEDAAVIELNLEDQLALKGMDYGQREGTDALRDTGEPTPTRQMPVSIENKLRPLVGKVRINLSGENKASTLPDMTSYIDTDQQRATSLTGELSLDWGKGTFLIDAPAAQGFLITQRCGQPMETQDLQLVTDNEILNLLAVSLDSLPLEHSKRILLQVMTEEKGFDFKTEPVEGSPGVKWITDVGTDPWMVKCILAELSLKGDPVKVTALDQLGIPEKILHQSVTHFQLLPDRMYYLLER